MLEELLERGPRTACWRCCGFPAWGRRRRPCCTSELHIADAGPNCKAACEAGQVRALKGFGAKTEQPILAGLQLAEAAEKRIYWAEADEVVPTS